MLFAVLINWTISYAVMLLKVYSRTDIEGSDESYLSWNFQPLWIVVLEYV